MVGSVVVVVRVFPGVVMEELGEGFGEVGGVRGGKGVEGGGEEGGEGVGEVCEGGGRSVSGS